jgi:hypothetical protein
MNGNAPRPCPGCGTPVPFETHLCPACHRFVPGGVEGIRESPAGRSLVVLLWLALWPFSMVFGKPREADVEVSRWHVLLVIVLGLAVLGTIALVLFPGRG